MRNLSSRVDIPNFATHLGMLKHQKWIKYTDSLLKYVWFVDVFFFSKIFEEAWLHIAHSMAVVSFYHLAIWHAFGIRLQRRKLEEQPHVGLGLVDAATLIELWIESLKTYWRLTSSTILLFYKLIFPIHRPSQSQLSTFKLRGNTSPAKLCRTLKRTPD